MLETIGGKLKKRLVIAITGASGVRYGMRILEVLNQEHYSHIETHVVISEAGKKNIIIETDRGPHYVTGLADHIYDMANIGAPIASGSFLAEGMVVIPCTINTLSKIAHSHSGDLISRAADVMLKERRKLLLAVRETPFHAGHLELMLQVTKLGGIIMPPIPSFYGKPKKLNDIVNQFVGRVLDQFRIENNVCERWTG